MNRQKEWTLVALNAALTSDLTQCHTALEQQCCKAIALREMRELWREVLRTRKPTPGEVSVAEHHGII